VSLRAGSTTARLPCTHLGSIAFSHGLRLGSRQTSSRQPAAAARRLDGTVVLPQPNLHLLADVPGGVVPDQRQNSDALGRELLGHPAEKGAGHRADRPPVDEAQQHPPPRGQPQAIAGQRLGLGIGAIDGVHPEAQGLVRGPGVQGRLRQAGEPDLVGKAERPAGATYGQPDQTVAAAF
jgi:hypothetical protein